MKTEIQLALILLFCLYFPLYGQERILTNRQSQSNAPLSGNLRIDLFDQKGLNPDSLWSPQLKDLPGYKSPLKAALFSAILPGAGQTYSERYWEGLSFFGAEVGLWVVYAVYQSKGNSQTDDFQKYADLHWSVVQYVDWITKNIGQLNPSANTSGIILPNDPLLPPWQRVDWSKLNDCESQIMQVTGNGFTHNLPHWPEQQYYELIGKYPQFVGGWDDGFNYTVHDIQTETVSPNFTDYRNQRGRANSLYAIASTASYVLVANHVLSALEAAWSAATSNANLKMGASLQPTLRGNGIVEFIPTARLRFDF